MFCVSETESFHYVVFGQKVLGSDCSFLQETQILTVDASSFLQLCRLETAVLLTDWNISIKSLERTSQSNTPLLHLEHGSTSAEKAVKEKTNSLKRIVAQLKGDDTGFIITMKLLFCL